MYLFYFFKGIKAATLQHIRREGVGEENAGIT